MSFCSSWITIHLSNKRATLQEQLVDFVTHIQISRWNTKSYVTSIHLPSTDLPNPRQQQLNDPKYIEDDNMHIFRDCIIGMEPDELHITDQSVTDTKTLEKPTTLSF